jgi:hypothetical protein
MRKCVAALALLACAYPVRPPEPPTDARERRAAEAEACRRSVLPPWLDDGALSAASRLDGQEAQAGAMNDAFIGDSAAASARPPPARTNQTAGSRVAIILEERRVFQTNCALLRTAGKELVPRPGP